MARKSTPEPPTMGGHLRQLDLTDFKSYSGHCTIGPFDPFTSIIGPNGSGKSNLMDAISFVLGVSSGKLRSNNLGELVHRPVSSGKGRSKSSNKATVSAVYIKEDGEELQFSRSVNVNGISEYFLNNQPISHAEYDKVLQSENILVKARNFLVFQGDVEAIASKTPKEFTRLLEQISGSDAHKEEYDRLKEEHERAVESSTFAFNKRRGLSAEIKAVQEQKEEVVRFEELLSTRQDLMTDLALLQLKGVEEEAKKAATEIETLQSTLTDADSTHQSIEKRYKEARKEQAKVVKEKLALEKRLKRAMAEQEGKQPELVAVVEKSRAMERRIQDGLVSHQRLTNERERLIVEQQALETEIETLTKTQSEKETELLAQLGPTIPAQHRAEYERLQVQVEEESAKERLKLDTLERKIAPQQVQRKQIEAKLNELQLRKNQVGDELTIVSNRLDQIRQLLTDQQSRLHSIEEQHKNKVVKMRRLAEEEAELQDRLHSVADKLLTIKTVEEESERERRLHESVESLKRIFPGVYGLVVECCQPTAKRYEEPLMAILANMADAVIVEHHQVAVECVKYLREQRCSPLTFIPIDRIHEVSGLERLRSDLDHQARLASDLLRTTGGGNQQGILKAVQFVCGTAVVCESLVQCRSIMSIHRQVSKSVSLEGHIVHSSGCLSGGRQRQSGKKWEEQQVRELKVERDQLMSRLQELGKETRRLEAEERLSVERVEVEERIRFLESESVPIYTVY